MNCLCIDYVAFVSNRNFHSLFIKSKYCPLYHSLSLSFYFLDTSLKS